VRILLDNCVHSQAVQFFAGHDIKTAIEMGWANLSNGQLLARASTQFDLLVTTDKNIRHQQNLAELPIAILELNARDTRIEGLSLLLPFIPQALKEVHAFKFVSVHQDGQIETLVPR
jgi:predicted nuclease of predicted toxin-antitoxin system